MLKTREGLPQSCECNDSRTPGVSCKGGVSAAGAGCYESATWWSQRTITQLIRKKIAELLTQSIIGAMRKVLSIIGKFPLGSELAYRGPANQGARMPAG